MYSGTATGTTKPPIRAGAVAAMEKVWPCPAAQAWTSASTPDSISSQVAPNGGGWGEGAAAGADLGQVFGEMPSQGEAGGGRGAFAAPGSARAPVRATSRGTRLGLTSMRPCAGNRIRAGVPWRPSHGVTSGCILSRRRPRKVVHPHPHQPAPASVSCPPGRMVPSFRRDRRQPRLGPPPLLFPPPSARGDSASASCLPPPRLSSPSREANRHRAEPCHKGACFGSLPLPVLEDHGGHSRHPTAKRDDVPHQEQGHVSGNHRPPHCSPTRLSVPPVPQGSARAPRPRVSPTPSRHIRSWLLLAQTCAMPVRLHPQDQGALLDSQVQPECRTRSPQRGSTSQPRLARPCNLGVPNPPSSGSGGVPV